MKPLTKKILLIVSTTCIVILTSITLSAFIKNNATEIARGKIIKIDNLKGIKAQGRLDKITYVFTVNNKDYFGIQRVGVLFPVQSIGNGVKVEFNKEDPTKSEAIGFYMDFKSSRASVNFHAPKEYGYHNIELVNDVYYYTNYADSGSVIEQIVGSYTTNKDTMFVRPYNHLNDDNLRQVKYLMVELPNKRRRFGIKNISNGRVYE